MEFRFSLRSIILAIGLLAAASAVSADLPRDSLYHVRTNFISHDGKEFTLSDLQGHPVVVTMAYTRCQFTCPMIVAKLKKIESALKKDPKLRILIISFDHKRDTPESMTKFLKDKDLDPSRWIMAKGKTSGDVREIASLLEINYKEERNGEFSHSNVIALLGKNGVKRSVVYGVSADHNDLVKEAKKEL